MTLLDSLQGDIRFAWRSLERAPAFTAVALTAPVIGIASVTTIVSFVFSYTLGPCGARALAPTRRLSDVRCVSSTN